MWRAHVLAMCSLRNLSWHHMRDTTLIDRYFYTIIYVTGIKWDQIEGDQTGSLSKTSHRGIQARIHEGFTVHEL